MFEDIPGIKTTNSDEFTGRFNMFEQIVVFGQAALLPVLLSTENILITCNNFQAAMLSGKARERALFECLL